MERRERDRRRLFTWRQKLSLLRASAFRCSRCGISVSQSDWHAHHVIEHSQGGATELFNGMVLCVKCHKEITNV